MYRFFPCIFFSTDFQNVSFLFVRYAVFYHKFFIVNVGIILRTLLVAIILRLYFFPFSRYQVLVLYLPTLMSVFDFKCKCQVISAISSSFSRLNCPHSLRFTKTSIKVLVSCFEGNSSLTLYYCHVIYAFQSESKLNSYLNVKELLARNRRGI